MLSMSRPRIATGVALVSAGLIAVTPAATPPPDIQQRPVRLTTVDAGEINFPEVGWNDLVANTTANWNGLMDMYDQTTAIYSLPSTVYTEGLPQVFKDLTTELQALATYAAAVAAQNGELDPTGTLPPLPDFFADPALNPVSALTLVLQNALSSTFASNAAEVGWTGVYQNMVPSINDMTTQFGSISTQLENLLTGGSFSMSALQTDITSIGTDLTQIGTFLSLAPTTILNDYLNGYPVESSAADPLAGVVPSIGDAYTLNAPFNANDNVATTPEFGLLTNPFATVTADTGGFGDGTSSDFLGTTPLETGTLASLLQTEQTLSDELLTETSTIAGSGVTAPAGTGALTVLGPDSINLNLNLLGIPVVGDIISSINTAITAVNTAVSDLISSLNTFVADTLNAVVNPFINSVNDVLSVINDIPGVDIGSIGDVSLTIPSIEAIPSIPTDISGTIPLPGVTEPGVDAYVWDLAQNEMSILGSIAGIAAPVTGTVSSDGIGNFLAPDAIMNLGSIFDSTIASILDGGPLTITATLPLDWANLVAESLQALFTA
jgi:hypothetical protein